MSILNKKLFGFAAVVFGILISATAVAHTDGIYNPTANSVGDTQGIDSNGGSAVVPSAPAYTYLGQFSSSNPGNVTVVNMPFTMTGTAGQLVFAIGVQSGTVVSAIYDPAGANVTLNPDIAVSAVQSGIYSNSVPSASGSKNIQVTFSASVNFLNLAGHAWLATGLTVPGSGVAQQTAHTTGTLGASITPASATGYLMFGIGWFNVATASATYSGTTPQVPTSVHADSITLSASADWLVTSNAAYTIIPKAATTAQMSYATYH